MSTVLSNPEVFTCSLCDTTVIVDGNASNTPVCQACLKGEAQYEAFKLLKGFQALCKGEEPYDVLLPEERAEQIQALMLTPLPEPRLRRLIESPDFTEPLYTWSGYEPTPEERAALLEREDNEAIAASLDTEDADRWELQS